VALFFMLPAVTWAQDQSPSDSSQPSQPQVTPTPAGRTGAVGIILNPSTQDQAPSASAAPPIQELGSGGWLGESLGPLHWGSLYVSSFSITQGYDEFRGGDPGALVGVFHPSIFRTSVVYNPHLSRTSLALQWHPQVGVVNGQFANNLSNQEVSFDVITLLSPRLTLRIRDHFSYLSVQNTFADAYLNAAQSIQNSSVQNGFLVGPGTWITNTAGISLAYALSPRTELTFAPSFDYSHETKTTVPLSGSPNGFPRLIGSNEYSGAVSLDHRLSLLRTVKLYYFLNAVKFENIPSYTSYNTIGGAYSEQFSPTWFVNLSAGASTAAFLNNEPRTWTVSARADVMKKFRSVAAMLAYSRGLSLSQYASRNFTDRVDLTCDLLLTHRLNGQVGFGYQRVNGPPLLSGKYGTSRLGYQLLPSLTLWATYVYRDQVGDGRQVFTQTRNSGYLTLTWDPVHHTR
jgi:hypothetical protein